MLTRRLDGATDATQSGVCQPSPVQAERDKKHCSLIVSRPTTDVDINNRLFDNVTSVNCCVTLSSQVYVLLLSSSLLLLLLILSLVVVVLSVVVYYTSTLHYYYSHY